MSDVYRCTKETEIATLLTEVRAIKENQSETKDLVIIVTQLVEKLGVTQGDVKDIKADIQILKEKPMTAVSKILYMIIGVVITITVTRIMQGV